METVKQCGFSTVAGLYIENLAANENSFNNYSDGTFSHNMEWITHEAIKVINEDSNDVSACIQSGKYHIFSTSYTTLFT